MAGGNVLGLQAVMEGSMAFLDPRNTPNSRTLFLGTPPKGPPLHSSAELLLCSNFRVSVLVYTTLQGWCSACFGSHLTFWFLVELFA